jgi:hypothetical protein
MSSEQNSHNPNDHDTRVTRQFSSRLRRALFACLCVPFTNKQTVQCAVVVVVVVVVVVAVGPAAGLVVVADGVDMAEAGAAAGGERGLRQTLRNAQRTWGSRLRRPGESLPTS